jgi:hypothetical protein
MKIRLFIFIPLLFSLLSCSEKSDFSVAGVTDVNATAIALSETGEIVDFVHIKKDSKIEKIIFAAPDNGDEVMVVVVGPSIHPDLPGGMVVSSKVAEGYSGAVTVEIKNDMVIGVMGNGIAMNSPLKKSHLEQVKKELLLENRKQVDSTTIVRINKYLSGLIVDKAGNTVPPDLTESEKKFLNTVTESFKSKDVNTLTSLGHCDPKDSYSASFIKNLMVYEVDRFQFMKFNPDHPVNKHHLFNHDGMKYRHSLPIEWVLRVYFEDGSKYHEADLLIGDDNGILKFPTTYAK